MEITINTNTLADCLSQVLPFSQRKGPLEILKNVKITARGNRVKFETNDMQHSIRRYAQAVNVDQDGEFLVDCSDLSTLINLCKTETVTLSEEGGTLTVKYGKGTAQFQTIPPYEYPQTDMPKEGVAEVVIPMDILRDCIAAGKGFVCNDEFKPTMKNIFAYVKGGMFGYCATDTRKLITDCYPVDNAADTDTEWYIDPLVFGSIIKASKNSDNVTIKVSKSQVSYKIGDTVIQTTQPQGKYPDFKRVIPTTWAIECAVEKSDLTDSLKRTALQSEENMLVKIDISPMDMTISADNLTKLKKSSEQLVHNGCNGEIKIGMNVDHLVTCLGACSSSEVILRLTDSSKPMLIYQADRPNATMLVMPMTLAN